MDTTKGMDKRIDTLFLRFAAIYGHLWLTAYQNEQVLNFAKMEWSESLKKFDNQVLKEALERTKNERLQPPTLPMFIDYCRAIKTKREPLSFIPKSNTRANPELVKHHIAQMRAYLK